MVNYTIYFLRKIRSSSVHSSFSEILIKSYLSVSRVPGSRLPLFQSYFSARARTLNAPRASNKKKDGGGEQFFFSLSMNPAIERGRSVSIRGELQSFFLCGDARADKKGIIIGVPNLQREGGVNFSVRDSSRILRASARAREQSRTPDR